MKQLLLFILILLSIQLNVCSQYCLTQGIRFETQSQIDSFPINYPGCQIIEGDVEIIGFITDLSALSVLVAIRGDLNLLNSTFTTLTGFNNMTHVEGDLLI